MAIASDARTMAIRAKRLERSGASAVLCTRKSSSAIHPVPFRLPSPTSTPSTLLRIGPMMPDYRSSLSEKGKGLVSQGCRASNKCHSYDAPRIRRCGWMAVCPGCEVLEKLFVKFTAPFLSNAAQRLYCTSSNDVYGSEHSSLISSNSISLFQY